MSPADDLINRSDTYLIDQLEDAAKRGDLCVHGKIAAEMRRRLYRLRMEQVNYHVGQNDLLAQRCDA